MRIIRQREHNTHTYYNLRFTFVNPPPEFLGSGFSFECDKEGKVNPFLLNKCARESLKECLSGKQWRLVGVQYYRDRDDYKPILCTGRWVELTVDKGEIVKSEERQTTPAVGECNHCGKEVTLYGFTNECECGALYNMSGQELSHPSNWGEETGEHPADLMRL